MNEAAALVTYAPAAREALREYSFDVQALDLVSISENVTFRVTDGVDGAAYVLRLHRPGYHTLDELNSERVWLRALDDAGIAVPVPVAARDGSDYVPVNVVATDEQRLAGVSRWTEGELLEAVLERTTDVATLERCFTQLGALMATLHNQASNWAVPAHFRRHAFDVNGLMGDAPFWGRFWEHPLLAPEQRTLLLNAREQIRGALQRYGCDQQTYSLIHADLHSGNLLVNGDRLIVIDFDDAGFGWHQYDIAVALRHLRKHAYFAAIQRALIVGYRSKRALSDDALALVPMFLLIRGMALLGWMHLRPELRRPAGELIDEVCAHCAVFQAPC